MKNPDPIQAMINEANRQQSRIRAQSQMTLGSLITRLEELSPGTKVALGNPHSYRGYYTDLAFEPQKPKAVGEVFAEAINVMGKELEGYKGGDFLMGENTPVFVATYGCCGDKLISINDDGSLGIEEDEF